MYRRPSIKKILKLNTTMKYRLTAQVFNAVTAPENNEATIN